jgi:CDGSH-type Zn-finger protein
MEKDPMIIFSRNTPYMAVNIKKITKDGEGDIAVREVASLCRCGKSKRKPFCDGSHNEEGLDEERSEDCPTSRIRRYQGEGITIIFNSVLCYHSGRCLKGLPEVFDRDRRPWIKADAADWKKIAEVIETCPSGALDYELKDENTFDAEIKDGISYRKNGPFKVTGNIELRNEEGIKPFVKERYALCRCGKSRNKPFCDGTHMDNPFED